MSVSLPSQEMSDEWLISTEALRRARSLVLAPVARCFARHALQLDPQRRRHERSHERSHESFDIERRKDEHDTAKILAPKRGNAQKLHDPAGR